MNCINCENCKSNMRTYFCFAKNDFIVNDRVAVSEKVRTGWKKGDKDYEIRRRKLRKEVD